MLLSHEPNCDMQGGRVCILPRSAVDSTWAAAYDNSTYQRHSESWRLQLRYHPAGNHVQSGTVLSRYRPSAVYVLAPTYCSWHDDILSYQMFFISRCDATELSLNRRLCKSNQSINQSTKFNSGCLAHMNLPNSPNSPKPPVLLMAWEDTHMKKNNKTLHYTTHYYYNFTTLHLAGERCFVVLERLQKCTLSAYVTRIRRKT